MKVETDSMRIEGKVIKQLESLIDYDSSMERTWLDEEDD